MNFRTYEDLAHIISNNLHKIPNDVDLVVGVPKSGLMAASMISLYLNLPLTDIDSLAEDKIFTSGISKQRNNWISSPAEARKILVVDDSSSTGLTFNQTKEKILKSKYSDKIVFLVVFVTDQTKELPDMYFDICPQPRMFEWNYMHHGLLENACVDIDGVLCRDPSNDENDDGEKYIDFISNVKPRVIPTRKIGYLVTTRLEKYRKYTEDWLKKNNIEYGELIMLDLPSKEERLRLGNHGLFKGENYKKLNNTCIFIESDERQASVIANVSGKNVYCVDNGKLFKPKYDGIFEHKDNIVSRDSKFKTFRRKIIPLKIRVFLKKILDK